MLTTERDGYTFYSYSHMTDKQTEASMRGRVGATWSYLFFAKNTVLYKTIYIDRFLQLENKFTLIWKSMQDILCYSRHHWEL